MNRGVWFVAALLAVSALGVARTQPRLARVVHQVKERDDVYALPPPSQLKLFDLGYDAATVDLLWAKLLVEYGMHWHERREFHPDPYIDAILYLEPTYGPVYRFADTLLCYHPLRGTEADARKTRAILEQGTRERPGDFEVWQELGQFTAFLAPSFLTSADAAERDAWRRDGALALNKAVDLGADTVGSLIAATILGRSGERTAAIGSLQKAYAYTDDPDRREEIARKLKRLEIDAENEASARQSELIEEDLKAIESQWKADWPFLTRGEFLLLGPVPNAAHCAGPAASDDPSCARDWDTVLAERRRRAR